MREMLRLILKENSFQVNGKLFLQTHRTAMGTKTAVSAGSFENEDRSTKHPKLENEAPKSRKRSTLSRTRNTQNSKTKHPKLENEDP